ncbi:uncharacterized protein TNCV_4198561 [Trichonephila clavipes]|nr:uncharacterized protein TNCV_4198561 [Trichonephila clavipes]
MLSSGIVFCKGRRYKRRFPSPHRKKSNDVKFGNLGGQEDIIGGETCKVGGAASDSFNEDGDSNSRKSPDDSLYRVDVKSEANHSSRAEDQATTSHQLQQHPNQQHQQFRFSNVLDSLPHHLSSPSMNDLEMRMVVGEYQSL